MKNNAHVFIVLIIFVVGIFAVVVNTDTPTFSSTGDAVKGISKSKSSSKGKMSKEDYYAALKEKALTEKKAKESSTVSLDKSLVVDSSLSSSVAVSSSSEDDKWEEESSTYDSSTDEKSDDTTKLSSEEEKSDDGTSTECSGMGEDDFCLTINGCEMLLIEGISELEQYQLDNPFSVWYQDSYDLTRSDAYSFEIYLKPVLENTAGDIFGLSIPIQASDFYGAHIASCAEKAAKYNSFDTLYYLDVCLHDNDGEVIECERFRALDLYAYPILNIDDDFPKLFWAGNIIQNVYTKYSAQSVYHYLPEWINQLLRDDDDFIQVRGELSDSTITVSAPGCTTISASEAVSHLTGIDLDFGGAEELFLTYGLEGIMGDNNELCIPGSVNFNLNEYLPYIDFGPFKVIDLYDTEDQYKTLIDHYSEIRYSDGIVSYDLTLDLQCSAEMLVSAPVPCGILEAGLPPIELEDHCTAEGNTNSEMTPNVYASGFSSLRLTGSSNFEPLHDYGVNGVCNYFEEDVKEEFEDSLSEILRAGYNQQLSNLFSRALYSYNLEYRTTVDESFEQESLFSITNNLDNIGYGYVSQATLMGHTGGYYYEPFNQGFLLHPDNIYHSELDQTILTSDVVGTFLTNEGFTLDNFAYLVSVNTLNAFLSKYGPEAEDTWATELTFESDELLSKYGTDIEICEVTEQILPPTFFTTLNSMDSAIYNHAYGEMATLVQENIVECISSFDGSISTYNVKSLGSNYLGLLLYPSSLSEADKLSLQSKYAYNIMHVSGADLLADFSESDLSYALDQLISLPLQNYVEDYFPSPNSNYFEEVASCDNFVQYLYVGAWCMYE